MPDIAEMPEEDLRRAWRECALTLSFEESMKVTPLAIAIKNIAIKNLRRQQHRLEQRRSDRKMAQANDRFDNDD